MATLRNVWGARILWIGIGILVAGAGFLAFGFDRSSRAVAREDSAGGAMTTADRPLAPAADEAPQCHLGVVLPVEEVNVVAEIEGRLEAVRVRVGDVVERGQPLAALSTQDLEHQLAIEHAYLETIAAQERRVALEAGVAEEEYRRRLELEGLLSQEAADAAEFRRDASGVRLEVARAEKKQIQARVDQVESKIARSVIRAPFDGTIALRYLDPGALATPGTPVVRLISNDGLMIRFAVPPEQAVELGIGQPVRVEIETPASITEAVIRHIAPEVDAAAQMLFVEAHIAPQGPGSSIPAGSIARVATAGNAATASCLEALAIRRGLAGSFAADAGR